MLTERELQQLKSENELLLIQLEDLNEVIRQRENELEILRGTARYANELQSRLDMNLSEFEQMQLTIGDHQQLAEGTNNRLEELEKEMLNAVKIERKYYDVSDKNHSLQANLADTVQELEEAVGLYKKVQQMKAALTESESSLEIAKLEIDNLKDELKEVKELNEELMKKLLNKLT